MVLVAPELVGAEEVALRKPVARPQGRQVRGHALGRRETGEAHHVHPVLAPTVVAAHVLGDVLAGDHHVPMRREPARVALQARRELVRREVLGEAVLLEIRDPLHAAELQARRRSHQDQVDLLGGIGLPTEGPRTPRRRRNLDPRPRQPLQTLVAGLGLQGLERGLVAADHDQPRSLGLRQEAERLDQVLDVIEPAGPGLLLSVAKADRQGTRHQLAGAFRPRRKPSSFSPCRLQT